LAKTAKYTDSRSPLLPCWFR